MEKSKTCLICIEQFDENDGVQCSHGHFICNAHINPYLSENIFPQIHLLKKNIGQVTCPSFQCDGIFCIITVFIRMADRERTRYLSIVNMLAESNTQLRTLRNALQDVMVLRCPTCKTPVDPYPDACSAVLCLNCGHHYCNYCFRPFASGRADEDRARCHTHVAEHSPAADATLRDAFLPADIVRRGQQQQQIHLLCRTLTLALLSREYRSSSAKHIAAVALILLYPDVVSLDACVGDIWNDANGLGQTGATHSSSCVEASQTELEQTGAVAPPDFGPIVNSGATQLVNALRTGNVAGARQILEAFRDGMDVNYVDPQLKHPLASVAMLCKQTDIAIALLQRGADPLRSSVEGRSVGFIAAEMGFLEVLREAVESKKHPLHVNAVVTTESNRYCLLHVAARYNHGHIISYLIDKGADVNMLEEELGYSPLFIAVVCGNIWAAQVLLRLGADVLVPARNGRLPLYAAVEKCQLGVVAHILSRAEVDINASVVVFGEEKNWSPLHVAALYSTSRPVFDLLVSRGAHINAKDIQGRTPLMIALAEGNEQTALDMINRGADVTPTYTGGRTALYVAIEKRMGRVVEELVASHGMDVNARCTTEAIEGLPLTIAILYKSESVLHTLLSLRAHVNTKEKYSGNTALMSAVLLSDYSAALTLLRADADPTICNNQGRAPLFAAVELGNADLVDLLGDHPSVNINAPVTNECSKYCAVHVATLMSSRNGLSALMRLGADLSVIDAYGRRALDIARKKGDAAIIAMLS